MNEGKRMTHGRASVRIHNMPEYAAKRKYVVASFVSGKLWFYGAWDDQAKADEVAAEIENGIVVIPEGYMRGELEDDE